jgi:hypothetical protein
LELAEQEAQLNHTSAAGQWGRRARNLAPLDERLLQRVVGLLDRLGDRAGAVREYETFARRLADELELTPSPETEALADEVRARTHAVTPVSEASAPAPTEMPSDVAVQTPRGDEPEPGEGSLLADRYRLEKQIGMGGMATVYLARDLRHERNVALKLMHPDLSVHMGQERFLHEIQIAAKLAHPHIVPVHDSGSINGQPYYVMPYVDGESLRDRLEREGQLAVGDALAIAHDVAEALSYAHERGVVHRDIKPENILLSDDHALVADFGIARAASVASELRLTKVGTVMGTPQYMSPEQSAGSEAVDGRSDVYSLACVLYEMLGGVPPFTGPTAHGIARQHIHAIPRPVSDLRRTVPDNIAAALERALAGGGCAPPPVRAGHGSPQTDVARGRCGVIDRCRGHRRWIGVAARRYSARPEPRAGLAAPEPDRGPGSGPAGESRRRLDRAGPAGDRCHRSNSHFHVVQS